MKIELDSHPQNTLHIDSYQEDTFMIDGIAYPKTVFLVASRIITKASIKNSNQLSAAAISEIINPLPDLLLIGTGKKTRDIPNALRTFLFEKRVHHEIMDSGAVCRVYNLLIAEGRVVSAILIPQQEGKNEL